MKPFQQWDRAVLMISSALIGLALACSDGASPGVHGANSLVVGPAVDIQIAPTSAALTLGGHSVLRCAAFDAQGVMVSSDRTWTSSDPSVASVASDGSLTALRPGGALVTCQIGGRSATSAITVSTATVAFVEVSPGAGTIPPGASLPLVGVPRDSFGIPVPGSNVQWSSADTAVAVVDAVGVVSARAAGDADIRAVSGGVAGTTKIKVTPIAPPPVTAISISVDATSLNAGQMAHASATTMDATGQSVSGRSIKWSASNPAVLSVVTANAVKANVRALTQGTATLTATSEGKSASVSLTVGAPTVASIATSLASPSIQVGHGTLASAVPLDGMGNPMTGQTATWTSLDPSIATVSSSGVVTGIAAGSVIIRATSNGITGDATLTVTPPSVAFVTTTLAPSSLATGQTTQATAVVMDAGGNTLSGRSVAWSSLNPNIATVSIAGVVTAVAPGSAVIRATVESKTGDATLVVNAPTPPTNPTNPTNPPPTNPPPTNPPPTNPPPTPAAQAVDTGAAFVSGPKTWANGNGPAVPVQTPLSPGWTATIPGAQWVWRTAVVANPMAAEVDTFTHRFVLNTSGAFTLDVASDNGFSVIVNGTVIADRLFDGGATYAAASHYAIPSTAFVSGTNVLTIIVRNAANPASSDPAQNPAGLLYRLALSVNPPPSNPPPTNPPPTNPPPTNPPPTGPPAQPSPGHPNEPTGFTVLASQSFDSLNSATTNGQGNYSIVVDSTSPEGSKNVGQMFFPAGCCPGQSPGSLYMNKLVFVKQMYISFWIKFSDPWQVPIQSGANKILYFQVSKPNWGNALNNASIEFLGWGGNVNTLMPAPVLEPAGLDGGPPMSMALPRNMINENDTATVAAKRGVWGHYEVLLTMNTPGNWDGGMKWWFNGILYGDYTHRLKWSDDPQAIFWTAYWQPTYGGSTLPVPINQWQRMKNFYVSGK